VNALLQSPARRGTGGADRRHVVPKVEPLWGARSDDLRHRRIILDVAEGMGVRMEWERSMERRKSLGGGLELMTMIWVVGWQLSDRFAGGSSSWV